MQKNKSHSKLNTTTNALVKFLKDNYIAVVIDECKSLPKYSYRIRGVERVKSAQNNLELQLTPCAIMKIISNIDIHDNLMLKNFNTNQISLDRHKQSVLLMLSIIDYMPLEKKTIDDIVHLNENEKLSLELVNFRIAFRIACRYAASALYTSFEYMLDLLRSDLVITSFKSLKTIIKCKYIAELNINSETYILKDSLTAIDSICSDLLKNINELPSEEQQNVNLVLSQLYKLTYSNSADNIENIDIELISSIINKGFDEYLQNRKENKALELIQVCKHVESLKKELEQLNILKQCGDNNVVDLTEQLSLLKFIEQEGYQCLQDNKTTNEKILSYLDACKKFKMAERLEMPETRDGIPSYFDTYTKVLYLSYLELKNANLIPYGLLADTFYWIDVYNKFLLGIVVKPAKDPWQ